MDVPELGEEEVDQVPTSVLRGLSAVQTCNCDKWRGWLPCALAWFGLAVCGGYMCCAVHMRACVTGVAWSGA